jgi:hypothetical protein
VLLVGALSGALGAIRTIRQRECFLCALGTFSVKESVSLYLGYDLVSKRECFLVLWARFSVKESVSLCFGYV